jgi:mono/diheme cytochrome c family protein
MRSTVASVLLVAGLLLAMAPRHAAGAEKQPWRRAPTSVHASANPYDRQADAVRAGRKLFARHCASCHGDQGRGGEAPRLDAELMADAAPGDLFWFLTNGNLRRGMPSWSRLPDARRWQLVAFLKTLDAGSAPRPASDPRAGAEGGPE